MLQKTYQSMIRLLSIGTLSVGMFVSGASMVVPPVPVAMAAEAAATGSGQSSAAAEAAPESNPYADSTQCIYRAWDLAAEAGYKLPWFEGNAADWKTGAIERGYEVADSISPDVVHSVAVWDAGAGGASWAGHVGWVVEVQGDRFLVQDRNWIPAADDERWVTWEEGISFIKLEQPEPEAAPAEELAAAPAEDPAAQPAPAEEPAAQPAPAAAPAEEPAVDAPRALQALDLGQLWQAEAEHLLHPASLEDLAAEAWAELTLGALAPLM